MKKLFFIVFAILTCIGMRAQTFTFNGDTYKINADGETVTLTDCCTTTGLLVVPDHAYYNGKAYRVTVCAKQCAQHFGQKSDDCVVVIGNYVETIETLAFQHNGQKGDNFKLILGPNVKSIDSKAFQFFSASGGLNFAVYLLNDTPSDAVGKTFQKMQNVTFFVHNEDVFNLYSTTSPWNTYTTTNDRGETNISSAAASPHEVGTAGVGYMWPMPYDNTLTPDKWVTVVFPRDLTEKNIIDYYGPDTKVAYLKSAKMVGEDNVKLHFEITKTVKANTPYLICVGDNRRVVLPEVGDPTAATLTTKVSVEGAEENLFATFVGTYSRKYLAENEFYLRSTVDAAGKNILNFYVAEQGDTYFVNTNKCYFQIVDNNDNPVMAKPGCILENETSGVNEIISADTDGKDVIYSLSGQRLSAPQHGRINIINGKKVMVK